MTIEEQNEIDAKRLEQATEIINEATKDKSLDEVRQIAINWCVAAMQHLANEQYWQSRAGDAERRVLIERQTLLRPPIRPGSRR